MDLEIQGKVALITGAGQGVGREIARVLAAEGARVVVNDFYKERAEAVGAALKVISSEGHGTKIMVVWSDSAFLKR